MRVNVFNATKRKHLAIGDTVIKYGIDMGKVVAPIRKGEHAHVHNIKTKRW